MKPSRLSDWKKPLVAIGIIIILVAIAYAIYHNQQPYNSNPQACVNRTFSLGSSGNCVSDGQYLLNWYLYGIDQPNYQKITGTYTTSTEAEVRKAQSGASLVVNGTLDPATWELLCSGNDTPSWWVSAAKNAGCRL